MSEKSASRRSWFLAFGVSVALVAALWAARSAGPFSGGDWAAWVQAIGAVIALAASFQLAAHSQVAARQLQEDQHRAAISWQTQQQESARDHQIEELRQLLAFADAKLEEGETHLKNQDIDGLKLLREQLGLVLGRGERLVLPSTEGGWLVYDFLSALACVMRVRIAIQAFFDFAAAARNNIDQIRIDANESAFDDMSREFKVGVKQLRALLTVIGSEQR